MRGFSLIEVLVAVSIVSILTLVAAPSFASFIKRDRLVTTANQLHNIYKFARSEAIKREQTVTLAVADTQWQVVTKLDGVLTTLHTFKPSHHSISVALQTLTISASGEVNSTYQFDIKDNDADTDDRRLCILQSGQSWLLHSLSRC
jgi:type IV fimbrial biogenesis protein FimT